MPQQDNSPQLNHSWLFFSFMLAGLGVLFLLLPEPAEAPGLTWQLVMLPLFVALPALGAYADHIRGGPTFAVAAALLLLALWVLLAFTGPPGPWSLGLFSILFIIAHSLHFAALPKELDPGQIRRLVRNHIAMVVGLAAVALSAQNFLSIGPTPMLWVRGFFVLTVIAALVFYFLSSSQMDKPDDSSRRIITQELSAFASSDPENRESKSLLLAISFATLGGVCLFYRVAAPTQIYLILSVGALSALPAAYFMRELGIKRALVLPIFCAAALTLISYLPLSSRETSILGILSIAVAGFAITTLHGLFALSLPLNRAGQGFGYLFAAIWVSVALGELAQTWAPWMAVPFFFIAIFWIQSVNITRSRDANRKKESERDMEWPGQDLEPQGQARHTSVTRPLQFLARTLAEIFFGRIRIHGRENLEPNQPTIIVANHPNTFLDPLLITAVVPGRLHYWAKATLWNMPLLGALLDRLGAIPIHRRKDAANSGVDNHKAMDAAVHKLKESAHVLIFPEGVSEPGLSLKPVKTGAARLGFQTIQSMDQPDALRIVPIALDYHEPTLFRTHVTVRIGEPLTPAAYMERFEQDQRGAVREVTSLLSESLKNMLPHLEDPELETLVQRICALYGDRLLQVLDESDESVARQAITRAVNHYQKMDPDTLFLFNQRLEAYDREQGRLSTPENHAPIRTRDLLKILADFFSFASYGLVTNWIPYRITGRIVEWFSLKPVWRASAKMLAGTFTFLFYYLIWGVVLYHLFGVLATTLVLFSFVLSAFIALGAMDRFAFRFSQMRTLWQAFWTQDTNEDLESMKVSLIQDLERFREAYAFYTSKEPMS